MSFELLRTGSRAPALLALALCLSWSGGAAAQTRSSEGSITRIERAGERNDAGQDRGARETGAAPEDARPRTPKTCATAYHASLKRIEAGEFARIEAARTLSVAGDPSLPGQLFLPPLPASRSKAEMSALAAANGAAKSRGRAGGATDADSRWLSDRLRIDLGDYLGQGPSPFLCGGVPAYVETLRRFADRIASSPDRRAALRLAQVGATRRTYAAALDAIKPGVLPRFAPSDRPAPPSDDIPTGGIDGLRPAAGLSRSDLTTVAAEAPAPVPVPVATRPQPEADPDLPPAKAQRPVPLDTVADMAAAVDTLLAAARDGGFVTEAPNQMAIGGHAGLSPLGFPVLSRIAKAREYVSGPRPLVGERTARFALASALSDIEALDYLTRAETQVSDPVGVAIHATLDAILSAHKTDCGCTR